MEIAITPTNGFIFTAGTLVDNPDDYTEDELLDVVKKKVAIVESWRTEALTVHGPHVASLLNREA